MASVKTSLKAAKTALDGQDYSKALSEAKIVLEADPQNYFGQVFAGRALEKQGEARAAIERYKQATRIKPSEDLAWKGLCTAYESQQSQGIDGHTDAALNLAKIYVEKESRDQCLATVEKLVSFAKEFGTRQQYKEALKVYLPSSPVFDFLEGLIPRPDYIFVIIADITQSDEKETINREIGERRTRLGTNKTQVVIDVTREVYGKSDLEDVYNNIINWTLDDELRRTYEEKLLQRAYDALLVLPPESKSEKAAQVMHLINDMIIIQHPFELAWDLTLELQQFDEVETLDEKFLLEFINFFPNSGIGKVLQGSLGVLPKSEGTRNDEDNSGPKELEKMNIEDRLLLMTDGLDDAKTSGFAHRMVAYNYLQIEEYQACVETSRKALQLIDLTIQDTGIKNYENVNAVKSMLGTSLVYYQSPKNHPEAQSLFEDVVRESSNKTSAYLGLALIHEEQDDYRAALDFLAKISIDWQSPAIKAEAAWCQAMTGSVEEGLAQLQELIELMPEETSNKVLRAQTHYRIGECIWMLFPDSNSRLDRAGAYASFMSAIKINVDFAPAYTALGIFYADYAKDGARSRQCFRRAIELSATEIKAAERLANEYANEKDWDAVEAIAQRAIDSGAAKPPPGSKKRGVSWPFAALGAVQINRQDFPKSIISFQSALRLSPIDYNSWIGLGESYHNSGRYIAARRALEHAKTLKTNKDDSSDNTWLASYMLSNVMHELAEYEQAVAGYRTVLSRKKLEFGVSIALLQTLIDQSWARIESGFYGLAAESAKQALVLAEEMSKYGWSSFDFWKGIGDACSVFSWIPSQSGEFPTASVRAALQDNTALKINGTTEADELRVQLQRLEIAIEEDSESGPGIQCLSLAVQSYKEAIRRSSVDKYARAVSWYNLGWAFHRLASLYMTEKHADSRKYDKSAVRCFKRAIELEAGNADFWNALGVATTHLNPKVAQHSFVRSLHLNERSARTWANLGIFYFIQNDVELAHNAFTRAQSVEPDYPYAWVGEGIVALHVGDTKEAYSHFTHAFEISDASLASVKKRFVLSSFDRMKAIASPSKDISSKVIPVFALRQLQNEIAWSPALDHVGALLQERVGDYQSAKSALQEVCTTAEIHYENSEDPFELTRYIRAKSDLARMQLAAGDFELAIENADTVIDLSSDSDVASLNSDERQKMRLSAHLSAGLAHHYLGNVDAALESFRPALEESDDSPDVVCLLAQVLWTKGEKEKGVARDQLFNCVEKYPDHFQTKSILGALSALDNDESTQEAVNADLISMRVSGATTLDQEMEIDHLLAYLADMASDESDAIGSAFQAQKTIMLSPFQPAGWSMLSKSSPKTFASQMHVKTTVQSAPPHGSTDCADISRAFADSENARDAQISIMLCPWLHLGWGSLESCVS